MLGVKATLLCLLFGYPIAWIASRAKARWQTVLLFLVILPIMTSVVVRTFSWIVILGRQGVLNQIAMGLGLTDEPLRLLFTELGVVIVLAQVQMPLMVLPILTVMSKTDPEPRRRVARARGRRVAHALEGDAAAVAARRDRRLHPDLFGERHRIRHADPDRRRAARLHAAAHLSAGDRRQQLAVRRGDLGDLHVRRADRRRSAQPADAGDAECPAPETSPARLDWESDVAARRVHGADAGRGRLPRRAEPDRAHHLADRVAVAQVSARARCRFAGTSRCSMPTRCSRRRGPASWSPSGRP